jgi:hypothetical protein
VEEKKKKIFIKKTSEEAEEKLCGLVKVWRKKEVLKQI